MATLHIEHKITGFGEWKTAFDRFAEYRVQAGVRSHTIRRPIDDTNYVLIDLDFDSPEAAGSFLQVLKERVWASRQNAPALVGSPQTRILETEESSPPEADQLGSGQVASVT
ncbi:MAG: hypothetical protein H0T91_06005 [Propionibacteriaceae bacterium]|nr:hypothetical protein [Propionibacteriaceae bacterium]